jgi:antirestriction protein
MIKLYCGTYHKYNSGSLHGKWFDLSDYSDLEELYEAFAELHEDEEDPEYMFQDYEVEHSFLKDLISESFLSEDIFEIIEEIGNSTLDIEVLSAFADVYGFEEDDVSAWIEKCEEAYSGEHLSDEDFAEELADELGCMNDSSSWPYTCIDWKQAARELMYDYSESDGHYFRQI